MVYVFRVLAPGVREEIGFVSGSEYEARAQCRDWLEAHGLEHAEWWLVQPDPDDRHPWADDPRDERLW